MARIDLKKNHSEARVRLRFPRITRYCAAKPYGNPEMLGLRNSVRTACARQHGIA